MSLFEYLSVAFSIVLSLAVVRFLSGLSVAVLKGRRYFPHALWIVFGLLASAMVWWNLWSFRGTDWNFLSFLFVLTVPSAMYLLAAALVPEQPGRVESWRDHFYAARTRIFVALSAFFALAAGTTWVLVDLPMLHPVRGMQMLALLLALSGLGIANRRFHETLPFAFLLILSVAATVLFFQPDSIARA